ncbi:MAG: DUF2867 domain-containing protein [Desulfobacteraceae bacterium]|jgi:hypothetical protein
MEIKLYNTLPAHSNISKNVRDNIHYIDSFKVKIKNKENYSIDFLTAKFFNSSPIWAKYLLGLRNYLVKVFGLKTDSIPNRMAIDKSIRYDPGDRAVCFQVIDRSDSEIVMAEDDKHLYFRFSILIRKNRDSDLSTIFFTTIVQFHNIWGRIYFMPVKPFHKLIIKNYIINLRKALAAGCK